MCASGGADGAGDGDGAVAAVMSGTKGAKGCEPASRSYVSGAVQSAREVMVITVLRCAENPRLVVV